MVVQGREGEAVIKHKLKRKVNMIKVYSHKGNEFGYEMRGEFQQGGQQ